MRCPPLLIPFDILCRKYVGIRPILVEPGIKTGMPILYENPQEVGADRIVNAVSAYEKHKKALIVVDFRDRDNLRLHNSQGRVCGRGYRAWHRDLFSKLFRTGIKVAQG